jgi:WD40 repeat protein
MHIHLVLTFLVGVLLFSDCFNAKNLNNFSKESLDAISLIGSSKIGKSAKTIYNASSPVLVLDSMYIKKNQFYFAAGCADGTIKIYDIVKGVQLKVLEAHVGSITDLYFDPFSKNLISSGVDKLIKVWNTTSFTLSQVLSGHSAEINAMTFLISSVSDSNQIVSASNDLTVKVWDQSTGALIKSLEKFNSPVVSLKYALYKEYSKSFTLIFTGDSDDVISAWKANDWSLLFQINAHKGAVLSFYQLTVSGHMTPLAYYLYSTGADKEVKAWTYDITGATLNKTFIGQTDVVSKIELDLVYYKGLAGSSYDKTVIVWDLNTQKIVKTLTGHSNKVLSLVTSYYNSTLISGDADGLIINWIGN